jgi:hypothetical protein
MFMPSTTEETDDTSWTDTARSYVYALSPLAGVSALISGAEASPGAVAGALGTGAGSAFSAAIPGLLVLGGVGVGAYATRRYWRRALGV